MGIEARENGELLRGFPSKYVLYLVISETKSRNDQTYNWGSDSGSDLLTHHLHLPHHLENDFQAVKSIKALWKQGKVNHMMHKTRFLDRIQ